MSAALIDLVDAERHDDWQRSLIYEKKDYRDQDGDEAVARRANAAAEQARLADAVGAGFLATAQYLFEALGVEDEVRAFREVPHLPNPLTAGEMSQLPAHAEQKLAERLHESLTPAQAAQPVLWTMCYAVWIGRGDFGSNLAAIFCEGPRANTREARTRNLLRRTGGLRRVRGNTSPLVDCPISAAWWRYRIALEVNGIAQQAGLTLTVDDVHEALRPRNVWENLVGMSLRRVTAVCESRARAAAVVALAQHGRASGQEATRAQVQGAIRGLARISHGHSLWHVPWERLLQAAERGIENADTDEVVDGDSDSAD